MKNVEKAARTSAAAFENAVRLHRDSVLLVENARYPSAFTLSVTAAEEIGKTFLLEEFVYATNVGQSLPTQSGNILRDIVSHRWKQVWFAKQRVDLPITGESEDVSVRRRST